MVYSIVRQSIFAQRDVFVENRFTCVVYTGRGVYARVIERTGATGVSITGALFVKVYVLWLLWCDLCATGYDATVAAGALAAIVAVYCSDFRVKTPETDDADVRTLCVSYSQRYITYSGFARERIRRRWRIVVDTPPGKGRPHKGSNGPHRFRDLQWLTPPANCFCFLRF